MIIKTCFGDLDQVFPRTSEGLRAVPDRCLDCPEKGPCLKSALDTPPGLDLRSGLLEREPANGFIAKLKRWSQKKHLSRLREQTKV